MHKEQDYQLRFKNIYFSNYIVKEKEDREELLANINSNN